MHKITNKHSLCAFHSLVQTKEVLKCTITYKIFFLNVYNFKLNFLTLNPLKNLVEYLHQNCNATL